MITLKESILSKTNNKIKDVKKLFAYSAEYEEKDLKPDQRKDILNDL